jgi:cell division protein FtsI (penicillin-binding protein 3)
MVKEVRKDILVRVYVVYLTVLIFGLVVIGRVVMIQQLDRDKYLEIAREQEYRFDTLYAVRGNILADDGSLLAVSIPIFEVRMDMMTDSITEKVFRSNVDSLAICLHNLFGDRTISEYKDMLNHGRRVKSRYFLIHRNVTYPELSQLRKFPIFRRGKYQGGLIIIPEFRREFPYKSLASRIIGYKKIIKGYKSVFGGDSIVKVGLEATFDDTLSGKNGQRLVRRISGGNVIPVTDDNIVDPQNGDDVVTTLDVNLQDLAESALRKELIADSADHGCVILMEVRTGYVRAIANLSRTKKGTYEEAYNYAVGESQETGSTFKLASFLVALNDGKVDTNTLINCSGGVTSYSGRKMEDSHHGLGMITAKQVFEKSSNVGTSRMIYNAYASNPQEYINGLYRIGINRPLQLQIPGEGNPYIKSMKSKYWSALSLPWMSIGYELALAPIHLITLYNAVANNGTMVKPLFVREIRRNGKVIQQIRPIVINQQIVSPDAIGKAKALLEGVVTEGTGAGIRSPHYSIAGKTGTAQIAAGNKGYRQGTKLVQYKGSFVGYFPADNPKYSCIVVIVNPKKGKYYGGAVAAPVFRELSDKLFAIRPDIDIPLPVDTTQSPIPYILAGQAQDVNTAVSILNVRPKSTTTSGWLRPALADQHVILTPEVIRKGMMPDVCGMGLKDAVYLLESQGMNVLIKGKGTVVRQSIAPGSPVSRRTPVVLELQFQNQEKKTEPAKEG